MNNYDIIYWNDEVFKVVVYSNSYINPIQDIKKISLEIQKHISKKTIVLFDMLLSNGENFNRFATAIFDGKEIQFKTIEIINITDESLLKKINIFYKTNLKALNNSILSPREKYKYAKA